MTSTRCILGVLLVVVYMLAANPGVTGVPAHEWLGLGVFLLVVAHAAVHFDWLVGVVRNVAHCRGMSLAKFVLDILLIFSFSTCVVSGFMVSGTLFQALGLYATGFWFWDPLHAASAKVLLALAIVHVAVSWKSVSAVFRKRKVDHE